jgi:hypothetical protein
MHVQSYVCRAHVQMQGNLCQKSVCKAGAKHVCRVVSSSRLTCISTEMDLCEHPSVKGHVCEWLAQSDFTTTGSRLISPFLIE